MRTPGACLAKMLHPSRFLSRGYRGAAEVSPDDPIAERLLDGQDAGPGASPAEQTLELIFKAAARPATEQELSGEEAAVAAFVLAATTSSPLPRSKKKRPGTGRSLRTVPVLVAGVMTAVVVALCGTAAAGALPAPLQRLAHVVFHAPAPVTPGQPAPTISPSPHSGGGMPSPRATPTHPAASPVPTGKTASPSASATSTASSNGNGKAKGKAKGKAEGKAKGKGTAKGKAKG